eukprot:gene1554-biopygen9485
MECELDSQFELESDIGDVNWTRGVFLPAICPAMCRMPNGEPPLRGAILPDDMSPRPCFDRAFLERAAREVVVGEVPRLHLGDDDARPPQRRVEPLHHIYGALHAQEPPQ